MMRLVRIFALLLAIGGVAQAANMLMVAGGPPAITGLTLATTTYTSSTIGTNISAIQLTGSNFNSATFVLSGPDAARFQLSTPCTGASCTLQASGVEPDGFHDGRFLVFITPILVGARGSGVVYPFTVNETVTCHQNVASGGTQTNIATAITAASAGQNVCFADGGTFTISSTVAVNKGVRLTGVNAKIAPVITVSNNVIAFTVSVGSVVIDHLNGTSTTTTDGNDTCGGFSSWVTSTVAITGLTLAYNNTSGFMCTYALGGATSITAVTNGTIAYNYDAGFGEVGFLCDPCVTTTFNNNIEQNGLRNIGTLVTNSATLAGTPAVLHFASVPASIIIGMGVNDVTNPARIPSGSSTPHVLSKTSTSVTLDGNTITPFPASGDTIGFTEPNTYPFVLSGDTNSTSVTFLNNSMFNNPVWECYDTHGSVDSHFTSNYALACGGNTAFNAGGTNTALRTRMNSNFMDSGTVGGCCDEVVMVPAAGETLTCTGGDGNGCQVENNIVHGFGDSASCSFIITTGGGGTLNGAVTVSGNVCDGTAATMAAPVLTTDQSSNQFFAAQANAVVGKITVAMTPAFPSWVGGWPNYGGWPGTFSIGGTDAAQFAICVDGQHVCQKSAGTAVGTYNITITGTLTGLSNSPQTSGTITLTGI